MQQQHEMCHSCRRKVGWCPGTQHAFHCCLPLSGHRTHSSPFLQWPEVTCESGKDDEYQSLFKLRLTFWRKIATLHEY